MKKLFRLFFGVVLVMIFVGCQQRQEQMVTYFQSEETKQMGLPFSDVVRIGDMLYLSGQIGNIPGELALVEGGLEAETRQTMENIKRVLEANGSSLDHAVKFTIFIDDIARWSDFNKVYVQYFDDHLPARSAFGAEGLALGAAVEVECIAIIPK
jgi:2-iminobutanoate/2-iminopropanoate deaminase